MGRFWLGVCLLAVLLALGLWINLKMTNMQQSISQTLEEAAKQTMDGDFSAGISLAKQAKDAWEIHWRGTASVADHAPMDEIDGLFAQLAVYAKAGQSGDFAAVCSRLAQLADAIGEAHSLTWWNLLCATGQSQYGLGQIFHRH